MPNVLNAISTPSLPKVKNLTTSSENEDGHSSTTTSREKSSSLTPAAWNGGYKVLTSLYPTFKLETEQQHIWLDALRTERVTDDELIRAINAWAKDTTQDNRGIIRSKFAPAIGELISLIRIDRQKARYRQQSTIEKPSDAERAQARIHAHPAVRKQLALSNQLRQELQHRYQLDYTKGSHSRFMLHVIGQCMADSEDCGEVGIHSITRALKIADREMERAKNAKASRQGALYA